jgi:Tol biopolymer transport system component
MPRTLFAAFAAVVALPLAVAAAPPSLASASPGASTAVPVPQDVAPNGQIAYVVGDCCQSDIWVVNPDGTDPHNITNTEAALEHDPSWSPDGTKIAYTRFDDEFDAEGDIWVMDADGGNQTQLTTSTDPEFQADWSPDGTQLVYAAFTAGEIITSQADIFVMNADGTNSTNITHADTDEIDPAWSPLGDRIAFAGVRVEEGVGGFWELVTMNPDGTDQVALTVPHAPGYEDRYPDWSPDGTKLVWMAQPNEPCCEVWDVWAMNADGSGQTNLTADNPATDWFPAWSPDGTLITFTSYRDSVFGDVYSMPAPTVLPPPPAAATADAGLRTRVTRITFDGNASNPAWGPATDVPTTAALTVAGAGSGAGMIRSGDGAISCPDVCTATFPVGTKVKLRARPAQGSAFASWIEGCTGTEPSCTVTVDGPLTVRARFRTTTP